MRMMKKNPKIRTERKGCLKKALSSGRKFMVNVWEDQVDFTKGNNMELLKIVLEV